MQADGASVETVEGLGTVEALGPLQQQFREHHALQCGFCTPGMLMTCTDLLRKYPLATEDEIREGLSGNICRCTGYDHIVKALRAAVEERDGEDLMKMHALSGGRLEMKKRVFYPDADGDIKTELPVSCFLLRHPQGNVLFDTGCHPAVETDAVARWGGLIKYMTPVHRPGENVVDELRQLELGPDRYRPCDQFPPSLRSLRLQRIL